MFVAANTLARVYLSEPDQLECDQQEMGVSGVMEEVQLCCLCFAD